MKKFLGFIIIFLSFSFTLINADTTTTGGEPENKIETLKDLYNENEIAICPSVGDVKGLVVPVTFGGSNSADLENKLDNAFNGDDLVNLSVSKYYELSSYGKLNFDFTIAPAFTANNPSSYYEKIGSNRGNEYLMVEFFQSNEKSDSKINFSEFDQDEDGKIDAIYLIYDHQYDENSDFYWAYTKFFNMPKFGYPVEQFVFMSSQFFSDPSFDGVTRSINSSTAIHETGHLLGLDDYYDYNLVQGPKGGLGGEDMMHATYGDHNPISKILLDWVEPTVIQSSQSLDLKKLENSKEVLVLTTQKEFSLFSEYILIDYFDSKGILTNYCRPVVMQFQDGVRVQRVDARISDQGTFGNYYSLFHSDNSDTPNKFIEVIEREFSNSISDSDHALFSNQDLFRAGDSLYELHPNFRKSTKVEYGVTLKIESFDRVKNIFTIEFVFYNDQPNAPIITFPERIDVKRNGKINFEGLKITDSNSKLIEEYQYLGDFDANVPGIYEGCITTKDNAGNSAIHFFQINVTKAADLGLAQTTIFICLGAVLIVGALGFLKVSYDKKYKIKK